MRPDRHSPLFLSHGIITQSFKHLLYLVACARCICTVDSYLWHYQGPTHEGVRVRAPCTKMGVRDTLRTSRRSRCLMVPALNDHRHVVHGLGGTLRCSPIPFWYFSSFSQYPEISKPSENFSNKPNSRGPRLELSSLAVSLGIARTLNNALNHCKLSSS